MSRGLVQLAEFVLDVPLHPFLAFLDPSLILFPGLPNTHSDGPPSSRHLHLVSATSARHGWSRTTRDGCSSIQDGCGNKRHGLGNPSWTDSRA